MMKQILRALARLELLAGCLLVYSTAVADSFEGRFFAGEGDREFLQLLDIARRMFAADAEFQNLAMLYLPSWNGLVEGPTWGAWWVQNSYGTTYAALPFYEEPFVSFVQHSQDLWFAKMGDGQTRYVWNGKDSWVPPDGCLMDCANETWAMHRQGDGRVSLHDWGLEFTAAGGVLQSELLLISRDREAVGRYLPKLERCAHFIESRRDPKNDLFLAGPAGNLLAPSYAGYKRPDGTYGMAYLAGLSVTYIAFLDRLAELEKLAGRTAQAELWAKRRASARQGLERLTTAEGYLVKSMDPDGTLHGVHGAPRYGYFEASPNHDAICFRVVGETQARKILNKIASIPGLRPHDLIVANCPSLDDMYEAPQGLWGFGTWVNGGHWTTCEARMMMAYYRLGAYADARRSMQQILTFARQFRLDNPLVAFGGAVYQPGEPINLTYDAFGAPAGLIRGLFEYLYGAEGLTLVPHLPDGIARLEQKFPIRFGQKRLYLALGGHGPITAVLVNGKPWKSFDAPSVFLPYESTPEVAAVQILAGNAQPHPFKAPKLDHTVPNLPGEWTHVAATVDATDSSVVYVNGKPVASVTRASSEVELEPLVARVDRVRRFYQAMVRAGNADTYEAAHARLAVQCLVAAHERFTGLADGTLPRLPARSAAAADRLYLSTTAKLCDGLAKVLDGYAKASDPRQRQYHALWRATSEATPLKPIRGEVIVNRTAAAWESQQVQEPCILPNPKDPTRLVMFYSGVPATNRNLCFIGKAWALKSAPFTWHQDAHNPVFSPAKQGWDSGSIRLDAVLHVPEEDAYYIYYSGTTASVQDRIGLAVCPVGTDGYSGITPAAIRRVGGQPVLSPEPAAPYFEDMASQAAVLREWDTKAHRWDWFMFYSYRGKDGILPGLRLATSPDGKTWTRHYNEQDPRGMGQIFKSTPGAYYEWHQVSKIGGTYALLIEVGIAAGKRWRPVLAVSQHPAAGWEQTDVDALLQTKWDGLYRDDTIYHVATPALYQVEGKWYLYAQACPRPDNDNYIDGRWDLWCVACDRLIPTLPGCASIHIPGQPTAARPVLRP